MIGTLFAGLLLGVAVAARHWQRSSARKQAKLQSFWWDGRRDDTGGLVVVPYYSWWDWVRTQVSQGYAKCLSWVGIRSEQVVVFDESPEVLAALARKHEFNHRRYGLKLANIVIRCAERYSEKTADIAKFSKAWPELTAFQRLETNRFLNGLQHDRYLVFHHIEDNGVPISSEIVHWIRQGDLEVLKSQVFLTSIGREGWVVEATQFLSRAETAEVPEQAVLATQH